VQPVLEFKKNTFKDTPAEIILSNKGIGPAIITGISVEVDDQPVACDSFEDFKTCVTQVASLEQVPLQFSKTAGAASTYVQSTFPVSGDALSPNDSLILLKMFRDKSTPKQIQTAQNNTIKRIVIGVEYESIYKESFSCASPVY
jgi:hypothetical protein